MPPPFILAADNWNQAGVLPLVALASGCGFGIQAGAEAKIEGRVPSLRLLEVNARIARRR